MGAAEPTTFSGEGARGIPMERSAGSGLARGIGRVARAFSVSHRASGLKTLEQLPRGGARLKGLANWLSRRVVAAYGSRTDSVLPQRAALTTMLLQHDCLQAADCCSSI